MSDTLPPSSAARMEASLSESKAVLESQAGGLMAIAVIFVTFTWITVGLRCYTRAAILKSFGLDDSLMVVALLFFTIYAAMCICLSAWLLESAPEFAVGATPATYLLPKLLSIGYCINILTMIAFKISLGMLFLRTFDALKIVHGYRGWRILVCMTIAVTTTVSVLDIIWTALKPCQLQMSFFPALESCRHRPQDTSWMVISAVWGACNIITDLIYGVLAINVINRLQLPLRIRVQGILICTLGTMGSLASIIRLGLLIAQWPSASVLGQSIHSTIWSIIEPGLGISASSAAMLRPVVQKVAGTTNQSDNATTIDMQRTPVLATTKSDTVIRVDTVSSLV